MEYLNGAIAESLQHKSILITGSTGYLAKIFVEKVLRIQPLVKRLFLVMRAADTTFAEQRMHKEVLEKDVFKVLRENYGTRSSFESFISDKLTAVAGDIALKDMGVKDSHIKEQLLQEVDIIVNFAATTRFDERQEEFNQE
ncbi:hypothetical protein Scep_015281 [Stephania cephalantha]|uniref:Fatty acyl-CoA reductase n=1 Tax=Stephania cephalantha TaxID=152367 RepID=A0AAP0J4B5_9MAGN